MENTEFKRITLHPVKDDGELDLGTNLYPRTLTSQLYDEGGNQVNVATDQDIIRVENSIEEVATAVADETTRATDVEAQLQEDININSTDIEEVDEKVNTVAKEVLAYDYFNANNSTITLPLYDTTYNLLALSSKGIADSATNIVVNPANITDFSNNPILDTTAAPITLYQTGTLADIKTSRYGYDVFSLRDKAVIRYCIPLTFTQLFNLFPADNWTFKGTEGDGRLLIAHTTLAIEGIYTENGFIVKSENNPGFGFRGLSFANFCIENIKTIIPSATSKAKAIQALTSQEYSDTLIIFKLTAPTSTPIDIDVNISELACDGVTSVGLIGFNGCLQSSFLSLNALVYSREQADEKFVSKADFAYSEHITKIGDPEHSNQLEATLDIYSSTLKSLGYPKYACANCIAPADESVQSAPFRGDTLFVNQKDGNTYGYFALSQNKTYWITKDNNIDIVTPVSENYATKQYVDTNSSSATNLLNGTGTNAIRQKMADATVNFTGRNPHAEAIDSSLSTTLNTGASGNQSAAFGKNTMALSTASFTNGNKTVAKGEESHAEGYQSVTLGDGSHAEGAQTVAVGLQSHSEGALTQALGAQSHAEGHDTIAAGLASHAEGAGSKIGSYSPSSDQGADQSGGGGGGGGGGDTPPSPGTFTAGEGSHAEGYNNLIVGFGSHAEGLRNYLTGNYAHVEGVNNTNSANYAHVEGYNNINSGEIGHVEGDWNNNSGYNAHVFGHHNTNTYNHKVVFGWYNSNKSNTILEIGKGDSSTRSNAFEVYQDGHAEIANVGTANNAITTKAYVDGGLALKSSATNITNGTGAYSLKQADCTSSNSHSFAEGFRTTASGSYAHAEGADTTASNDYAHAEGANTVASGAASHASGLNTNAKLQAQTVVGKFNADAANSLFIVGNGTADSAAGRTNAFVVYSDGHAEVGLAPTNNMDVVTKQYVDDNKGTKLYKHELIYYHGSPTYLYFISPVSDAIESDDNGKFTYSQMTNILLGHPTLGAQSTVNDVLTIIGSHYIGGPTSYFQIMLIDMNLTTGTTTSSVVESKWTDTVTEL